MCDTYGITTNQSVTNGTTEGYLFIDDGNIAIGIGRAIDTFGGQVDSPYVWNGIIYYSLPTPAPTETSTKAPTIIPTTSPTATIPSTETPTISPTTHISINPSVFPTIQPIETPTNTNVWSTSRKEYSDSVDTIVSDATSTVTTTTPHMSNDNFIDYMRKATLFQIIVGVCIIFGCCIVPLLTGIIVCWFIFNRKKSISDKNLSTNEVKDTKIEPISDLNTVTVCPTLPDQHTLNIEGHIKEIRCDIKKSDKIKIDLQLHDSEMSDGLYENHNVNNNTYITPKPIPIFNPNVTIGTV